MDKKFIVNSLLLFFFWMILPFINVSIYALFLPYKMTMIGFFINLAIWPLIVGSVIGIVSFFEEAKELIGRTTIKKSRIGLALTISLLYSFIAAIIVSIVSENSFSRCFWVYILLGICWAVLFSILYKKNIFSRDTL